MTDAQPTNKDQLKAKDAPEERIQNRDQMRPGGLNRTTPREAENEKRGK